MQTQRGKHRGESPSFEEGEILLFQREASAYRLPLYTALFHKLGVVTCHSRERRGASLKDTGHDLTVPHERLSRIYFALRPTTVLQNVLPALLKYRPKVVITQVETLYLTHWLLRLLRPFFGYKMIALSHGVINTEMFKPFGTTNGRVRLWIFKHIDAVLLYDEERKTIVDRFVKGKTETFVVRNSTDTREMFAIHEKLAREGRESVGSRLGYREQHHLVFISRLDPRKRLDLLVAVFDELRNRGVDVALHIIGDGPEKPRLERMADQRPSLFLHGSIHEAERKGEHLFAADLAVMPGDVGLSIVDSFSFGTPFVTLKPTASGPYHGPELSYLRHGENGLILEHDVRAFAGEVEALLVDTARVSKMSKAAHKTAVRECSIEIMVEGFERAIGYVLDGREGENA